MAFCPYCGVINENYKTAFSHVRKHLDLSSFVEVATQRASLMGKLCIST